MHRLLVAVDAALGRVAPAARPFVAVDLGAVKLDQVAHITGVDVGAVLATIAANRQSNARSRKKTRRVMGSLVGKWRVGVISLAERAHKSPLYFLETSGVRATLLERIELELFEVERTRAMPRLALELVDARSHLEHDDGVNFESLSGVHLGATTRSYFAYVRMYFTTAALPHILATLHGRTLPQNDAADDDDIAPLMELSINGIGADAVEARAIVCRVGEQIPPVVVAVAGGNGLPTLHVSSALSAPPGVLFDEQNRFVGTPTVVGLFAPVVIATDASGNVAGAAVHFAVELAPPHAGRWRRVGERLRVNYELMASAPRRRRRAKTRWYSAKIVGVERRRAVPDPYAIVSHYRDAAGVRMPWNDNVNIGDDVKVDDDDARRARARKRRKTS